MFNDHQDNQSQAKTDIDQVATDITNDKPAFGLGTNPTTFTPVMPPQATTTAPPPSEDTSTPDFSSTPEPVDPAISTHSSPQVIAPSAPVSPPAPSAPISSDLDEIKTEALKQLSPLVSKLEQPPEERFKTLMMMIQASDNHDLIKEAYEAANKIEDESLKAEALLAIVNEINYFTQKQSS